MLSPIAKEIVARGVGGALLFGLPEKKDDRGSSALDPDGPVPLVSYGGDSTCQRPAVAALHRAGLDCNFVFTSHSTVSLAAAVAAGFGVMAVPRGRAIRNKLAIWEDAPLPKLPDIYCAIFVRDGGERTVIEELADYLKDEIRLDPKAAGGAIAAAAARTGAGR